MPRAMLEMAKWQFVDVLVSVFFPPVSAFWLLDFPGITLSMTGVNGQLIPLECCSIHSSSFTPTIRGPPSLTS